MGKWSIWKKPKENMTNEGSMGNGDTMANEGSMGNGDTMANEGSVGNNDTIENDDCVVKNMEQMYIPGGTDKLESAVDTLITAILECEEYVAYRAELDRVLQIQGLKGEIDEYRKRTYQLQSSMDIDFEKLDRFEKEYENFRNDPAVSDFLAAELAFCKRMQEIEDRVTAELDFQ